MKRKITVALVGQPNCGKTTLFNKLTRSRHKTGNYPGVTVEVGQGIIHYNELEISVIDLPGIYSLTSQSEEEIISRNYIINEKPDLIINILDSSILERGLYLTTQLMELQVPLILVCNKIDLAKAHDIKIDFQKLFALLEVEIVPMNLVYNVGTEDLLKKIQAFFKKNDFCRGIFFKFSEDLERSILSIQNLLEKDFLSLSRWHAIKLIESDSDLNKEIFSDNILKEVNNQIEYIKKRYHLLPEEIIAIERNTILSKIANTISKASFEYKQSFSDRIDKIVLNKYLGLPLLLILFYLVFQLTFYLGSYSSLFLQKFFRDLSFSIFHLWVSDSFLRSLLVDGVIGGVGSVLSFVPNILLLFIAISFLEESGYMARAAFVMDRIMHKIGLHGRSFLPMIIGFGCTATAIMSTRILENKRDRITTILVLPLIACSAKLAVFTLLIPAFFSPANSAKILFFLYIIGISLSIILIKILRFSLFKGENIQFIMEMPPYQMPPIKNIFLSTWEKGGVYVKKAGTFILAFSVILWFLSVFPINRKALYSYEQKYLEKEKEAVASLNQSLDKNISQIVSLEFKNRAEKHKFINRFNIDLLEDKQISSMLKNDPLSINEIKIIQKKFNQEIKVIKNKKNEEQLYFSFMGRIGRSIEPFFFLLGFDWRINTALLGGISAKEVFITQLGIVFSLSEAEDSISMLQAKLNHTFSTLQGFCVLLFLLISTPCIATIAMTKKETGSYRWAFIQIASLTFLAYVLTFIIYQIGKMV